MKISTKGRYALRLMLDLATYNTGEPISIKDIAGRQEISEKYLEQIISILNRAGFVRSVRGAQGGYLLTRDPKDYTVGMIFRLTEGDLAPIDGLNSEGDQRMSHPEMVTMQVYEKINDAVNEVVDNITLADLVAQQNVMADTYII